MNCIAAAPAESDVSDLARQPLETESALLRELQDSGLDPHNYIRLLFAVAHIISRRDGFLSCDEIAAEGWPILLKLCRADRPDRGRTPAGFIWTYLEKSLRQRVGLARFRPWLELPTDEQSRPFEPADSHDATLDVDTAEMFSRALGELPATDRLIVAHYFGIGRRPATIRLIAEDLSVVGQAIHSQLQRYLAKLRALLRDEGIPTRT